MDDSVSVAALTNDPPSADSTPMPDDSAPGEPPDASGLIARIREGDANAYETLFRTYHAELCSFAVQYVRSMDAAEDAVEDVMATLWIRRAEWDPRHGVRAYLFGAVRNRALTRIRDAGRRNTLMEAVAREDQLPGMSAQDGDLAAAIDVRDRLDRVWAAVDTLSETQRVVVTLRWRNQLSFDEIATVLETSRAAVQMHLSRALKVLRTRVVV